MYPPSSRSTHSTPLISEMILAEICLKVALYCTSWRPPTTSAPLPATPVWAVFRTNPSRQRWSSSAETIWRRSLLRLASVSKAWQIKICRSPGCRFLWRTIDFSKVGPDRDRHLSLYRFGGFGRDPVAIPVDRLDLVLRERIDGPSLAALLRRIDARSVTETLILDGCLQISGVGLQPLRGSRVLKKLGLFFSGSDGRCNGFLIEPDVNAIVRTIPRRIVRLVLLVCS